MVGTLEEFSLVDNVQKPRRVGRVLLTGGAGFIGSHLVKALLNIGVAVRVCCNDPARLRNHANLQAWTGCDLLEAPSWAPAALESIDVVVHTAALAHVAVEDSPEVLERYRAVNTEATRRLAELAAAQGVKRFIFLSTIKVNGERTLSAPFTVADQPAPQGPYAVSKYEAERALWALAEKTGLEVVIIRPPLVYGPGVKANFAQLSHWVRRGVPLPLAGIANGRSLVSVYNLVDLILNCLEDRRAGGRTLLVSDGEAISTPELIQRLGSAWGTTPRLFHCPLPLLRGLAAMAGRGAALQRLCENLDIDIEPTRRILDWSPPCSMEETLARMVESQRRSGRVAR